jgi:hypothetical protein
MFSQAHLPGNSGAGLDCHVVGPSTKSRWSYDRERGCGRKAGSIMYGDLTTNEVVQEVARLFNVEPSGPNTIIVQHWDSSEL